MNIKIKQIVDHGHNDERIVLSVVEDDDIGRYLIMDSTYTSSQNISNKLRHTYWFPDKKVKAGDLIILYTKHGKQSQKANKNGTTSHFFYWDLKNNVWNDDGDAAVLFYASEWTVHKVSSKK